MEDHSYYVPQVLDPPVMVYLKLAHRFFERQRAEFQPLPKLTARSWVGACAVDSSESPFLPDSTFPKTYNLSKSITAIRALPPRSHGTRMGGILKLPKGAHLQIWAKGFNERTVKVKWKDSFYFVFLQDLESGLARQR